MPNIFEGCREGKYTCRFHRSLSFTRYAESAYHKVLRNRHIKLVGILETTVITVKIGQEERHIDDVDPQWINQQINARRSAGETVCIRVKVSDGEVDLLLSTPTCGSGAGGGRKARPRELEVLDLWRQRGLNEEDFTGGGLVAFLKQVERIL